MKQKNLAALLAVTLSFELMVSPIISVVHADDAKVTPSKSKEDSVDAAKVIDSGLNALGKIWTSVSGQMNQGMNSQMAADMANLQGQQTPQPDKYFNAQKLSQIPGLAQYLALNNINPQMLSCATLRQLFTMQNQKCVESESLVIKV